ncbi:hypothetical protein RYZ26_06795 [Terasakiella sp. A23]|uniref:hypothetical protein n=1 Tax=Terasakiella sp. FCG-A23 TaxID=3080561 RepID=UPI0029548EDF|nr:hypothetical protein [Terasakiella sp. A23]MDV7339294.1 hypothetical protein [Terasakiella sp. A23]
MWRYLTFVIGATVAVALLTLSVPRLVASFELLYVQGLKDLFDKKEELTLEDLKKLHEGYLTSLNWQENNLVYLDKAKIELALAKSDENNALQWRENAESSLENSIQAGPSNPYAWSLLAYVRKLNAGEYGGSEQALSMALWTGPYERRLAPFYLRFGFDLWDKISSEEQIQLINLVGWVERNNRRALIEIAKAKPDHFVKIVNALSDDEEAMLRFVKLMNRSRR